MPKNDIGGFFVSLGLNLDKNSWNTGNRIIDVMGNSLNKLIGTARNAAVVLAGTAVASGVIESSAYKTSVALGVTTEALDLWKASAKIAGVNANGLIGSMGQLANVMNHMKIDGSGLEQFSKKLGELGIVTDSVDIAKMLEMSPDELMKEIISKAQEAVKNGNNLTQVATIVGDILGDSGENFFIELDRQGKTIDEFLAGTKKTIFTDSTSNAKAADFAVEVATFKTELESATKLLGSEVGGVLTPYLKDWNKWIQENRDNIKDAVEAIAIVVDKVAGYVVEVSKRLVMGEAQSSDANTVNKVLEGKRSFNFKENGIFGGLISGLFGDADYSLLADSEKEMVARYYQEYNTLAGLHLKNADREDIQNRASKIVSTPTSASGKYPTRTDYWKDNEMNDGIMRPDGTVTQVAPDDWVFAARNLGDLARAFIPQNYTAAAAPSEYVINQTFNINGGNDMPQVLRQQAYRGTQEGLLEIMNQSSQRMQLMSGTR